MRMSYEEMEELLWDSWMKERELRRLFDAYIDPRNDSCGLLPALSSVQKALGHNWANHVNAVMDAMEVHDAGLFPVWWLDELDGGTA